jgi:hypothetical protein
MSYSWRMTEAEWLACNDTTPMLRLLHGRLSERKFRLFACACGQLLCHPFQSASYRRTLAAAEAFAEGRLNWEALDPEQKEWAYGWGQGPGRQQCERRAIWGALQLWAAGGAEETGRAVAETGARLGGLLRCLVGPLPFRPLPEVNAAWLAWDRGTVARLAQAVYDERAFDRLPILADALEEAGCAEAELLAHLRGGGPHARGCWAVDLLLGQN